MKTKKCFFIVIFLGFIILTGCTKIADFGGEGGKDPSFLNKPQNLFAVESVEGNAIYLSWTAVLQAKNYLIFQSNTQDGEYTQIGQSSNNYFTLTNPSNSYYYKVQAKAGETLSEESDWAKGINIDPALAWLKKVFLVPLKPTNYTDLGSGIVKDNITGFFWQKCAAGQDAIDCSGNFEAKNWNNAKTYCASLNLGGKTWRLPEINELVTLLDLSTTSPAINTEIFPNTYITLNAEFWSNTTHANFSDSSWIVWFSYGRIRKEEKSKSFGVRCVANQ